MRVHQQRFQTLDTSSTSRPKAKAQGLKLRTPNVRNGSTIGAATRQAGLGQERGILAAAGMEGLYQTLVTEHKKHLESPFVVSTPNGPMIHAKESLLDAFVGPQTILSRRILEKRLRKMGVENPSIDRVSFTNVFRASKNEIHIPADQLQLLIREQNLDDLSGRLNAPSGFPKIELQNGKLTYTLPVENTLEMRGVRAAVAKHDPDARESGRKPNVTPEQAAEAIRQRLIQRGVENPEVRTGIEDGRRVVQLDAEQAEILLQPISAMDPEAQVQEGKIPFNANAKSFDPENLVYLAQLSKLVYEDPGKARDAKEIERIAKTIGMIEPKLIEVNNSQALVGFVPSGNDGAGSMVVVSRGSEKAIGDWLDNGRIAPRDIDFPDRRGDGLIHRGFMSYWDDLAPEIDAYYKANIGRSGLDPQKTTAVFTGHSLGGASSVAGWTRSALAQARPDHRADARESFTDLPVSQVYTFGQPRVVSNDLGQWLEAQAAENGTVYSSIVNNRDLVTHVPPPPLYQHFGDDGRRYFNANGYLMDANEQPRRRDSLDGFGEKIRDHEMARYLGLARKHLAEVRD